MALSFLCVSSLFFALAFGFYGKGSNVIELSTENFAKEVFGSNDVWLVEFYAPWCGHCKNLAPQWEAAATKLKGLVKVAAVNCDVEANKQLAGYFQIQGFPTIKAFPADLSENPHQKGAPFKAASDYQGARSADAIVAHALSLLKYYGEEVNDKNLDSFVGKEGPKVLLFTDKPKTTSLYKSLSGHFNGLLHFGQVQKSSSEAVSRYGVTQFPSLLVVDSNGDVQKYSGALTATDIQTFLAKFAPAKKADKSQSSSKSSSSPPPPPPATPVVSHVKSQQDFDENCPSGLCVIAFLNPEDEVHEKYLAVLKKMSEDFVKSFRFLWLDGLQYAKFAREFGKAEDLPGMVVLSTTKKVYTPFVGAFDGESMKAFLGKVLSGKRRPVPLDSIPKLD